MPKPLLRLCALKIVTFGGNKNGTEQKTETRQETNSIL